MGQVRETTFSLLLISLNNSIDIYETFLHKQHIYLDLLACLYTPQIYQPNSWILITLSSQCFNSVSLR